MPKKVFHFVEQKLFHILIYNITYNHINFYEKRIQ